MSAADQVLASADAVPLSLRGPAPKRVVAGYGFWLFLLSDIVIFAALFAAYAVLSGETAGGPTAADLFDKRHVLIETACLLASSVTCGFGSLAVQSGDRTSTYSWMAITFILGVAFLSLEVSEFSHMLSIGAGPSRSAFLSAFFTLVGTHGLACDHRPLLAGCHAPAGGDARIPADGKPPLLLLWFVLARARHRLDRCIYHRLPGSSLMSTEIEAQGKSPGAHVHTHGVRRSYLIGLGYAVVLTLASFWASSTDVIYPPGVPILLGVLAIAQMGVHLVFFLHISSAPDQTNNFLALAFGIFVVGSLYSDR